MSQVIAAYQVSAFSVPVNGTPADADIVRGNDNAVRTAFNSHDADAGVHFQSSTLAARPAAGTAGRKWMTSDGLRIFFDNGAAWVEAGYLPAAGGTATGTITAPSFVVGSTTLDGNGITHTGQAQLNGVTVALRTGGTLKWLVDAAGHLTPGTSTFDLGSSALPVRTLYALSLRTGGSGTDVQVVGSRITGWNTWTGTASRVSFNTGTATLANVAQVLKALIDDLFTHGMIGT